MKNWTHTLQTSSHSDPLLKLKKKHDIPSAGFGWRFSHMYIERRKDNVAFICGRLGCVCSPDFHSCKSRNRRSKFKSGDCNPHSCSSYYGLGDCISHRRTKWYIGNQQKSWLFLILSGLATGASWLCYYKAIQLGSVSKVVPIDKLSVVITLILAFVFLHEEFTVKSAVGAVLITAGTLIMVL